MDQEELLIFVVRAVLAEIDGGPKVSGLSTSTLAREAGVAEYHVTATFEEMRRRKWVHGYLGGELGTTRDNVDRMRAFVNPLPVRRRTRAEIERAVASAMVARIAANSEFSLADIATQSGVHPGNVQRLFSEWESESDLTENGSGEIDWGPSSLSFLEALVDEPVEWGVEVSLSQHHHHGDTVAGDKNQVTVQGSTIGAIAVGEKPMAVGVAHASSGHVKEAREVLRATSHALVDAEGALSSDEHEELHQLLRMLKSVELDVADLVEAQRQAKAVLDDLFASGEVQKLRTGPSATAKEVIKALLGSPVFTEVVKALIAT